MRLDRNTQGRSKYAIVNLRKLQVIPTTAQELALAILENPEAVEFDTGADYFVMKLKDVNTPDGLIGYANSAQQFDTEYANDIRALAVTAFSRSDRKIPD